jgi:hypothetical protein
LPEGNIRRYHIDFLSPGCGASRRHGELLTDHQIKGLLDVRNTQVTERGIKELRSELPMVQVDK